MASGAVIGALRVVIGADTAALDKGLKDAQGSLGSFARRMSEVAAGVGLERIIEKSVTALVSGLKHALTAADDLGKAAQKIGLPVEDLSALKYAADLADVSFETLTKSLVKFDKNLAAAAAGGTNEMTDALDAMDIELKNADGSIKTQTQLIGEIADKFKLYEDSANKTALAVKLFGKSGAELIPLLNQGKSGLQAAAEEARKFGLIIDKDTAAAAEQFNDNLKRLGAVVEGVAIKFIGSGGLADALSQVSTALVSLAGQETALETFASGVGTAIKAITKEFLIFGVEAQGFINTINVIRNISPTMKLSEVFASFNAVSEETNKKIERIEFEFNRLPPALVAVSAEFGGVTDAMLKVSAPAAKVGEDAKNAIEKFLEATRKSTAVNEAAATTVGKTAGEIEKLKIQTEGNTIAEQQGAGAAQKDAGEIDKVATAAGAAAQNLDLARKTEAFTQSLQGIKDSAELRQKEAAAVGLSAGAQEKLRVQTQLLQQAEQQRIPITAGLRAEIDKAATAAGNASQQFSGAQSRFENTDPLVKYRTELANITAEMKAAGASADEIAKAQDRVAEKYGQSWSAIGANIAGTMGQLSQFTKTVGKENKSLGLLSKALGIGQAIINTQIAVTKALAQLGPTPAGFAAAALAIATGATAIATIASQGFAQGGSFRIPGGTSLSDNQTVPLSLAAGERVDITPAGQGAAGTTVNIDLGGGDGFYTRNNIERLLDALHTVLEDGHNVRLAVVK